MRNRIKRWRSNVAFVIVVALLAYVMYKCRDFFGLKDGSVEGV